MIVRLGINRFNFLDSSSRLTVTAVHDSARLQGHHRAAGRTSGYEA